VVYDTCILRYVESQLFEDNMALLFLGVKVDGYITSKKFEDIVMGGSYSLTPFAKCLIPRMSI